jgi:hypothetical protein
MRRLLEMLERVERDELAELVSAASYGTVLVLAALSVVTVSEVELGHGAELVVGVGVATWVAHLFAELLGEHVRRHEPLKRGEVKQALVDGSPILAATVLPAIALLLGRLDLITDSAARIIAILVAVLQMLSIGALVARVAPASGRGLGLCRLRGGHGHRGRRARRPAGALRRPASEELFGQESRRRREGGRSVAQQAKAKALG